MAGGAYAVATKNTAFRTWVSFRDYATPGRLKANPTLVAGDVTVEIDGVASTLGAGSTDKIVTIPAAAPASSVHVQVDLSASEMDGDIIGVLFKDQTSPPEWEDFTLYIHTV